MDDSSTIPPVRLADLSSMLERVVSQEIDRLQAHAHQSLQKEMAELRQLIKAAMANQSGRPKLRRGNTQSSAVSFQSADSKRGLHAHAWIGRGLRSYAAAAEMNRDSDHEPGEISVDALLPGRIPKGSGPFAKSLRRSQSNRSDDGRKRHANGTRSPACARHKARLVSAPATPKVRPAADTLVSFMTVSASDPHHLSTQAWSPQRSVSPSQHSNCLSDVSILEADVGGDDTSEDVETSPVVRVTSGEEVVQGPEDSEPGDRALSKEVPVPSKHLMPVLPAIPSESAMRSDSLSEAGRSVLAKFQLCRSVTLRLVRSIYFDHLTVFFILANTCTIGLQTNHMAVNMQEHAPFPFPILDIVFSVFFAVEVALKLFAFGTRFFTMPSRGWNLLDLFVVSLGLAEELVAMLSSGASSGASGIGVPITLMRMLRILRLVRVLRVARLLRYLTELRTIIVSMMSSIKALLSAVALLGMVIYMMSIYFTQLALHHHLDMGCGQPEGCREDAGQVMLDERYGSVLVSSLSLFQAVTGGLEWRHMSDPLMEAVSPWMGVVFSAYVVFTSLALMNIVTGVFLESALQRGRKEKDTYMINNLRELFGLLDNNMNGVISWAELEDNLADPKLEAFFKDIDIHVSEARNLFDLLDRDNSGSIDADEFLSGCLRLRGEAKAVDLQLVMCELAEQRKSLNHLRLVLDGDPSEEEENSPDEETEVQLDDLPDIAHPNTDRSAPPSDVDSNV